MIILDEARVRRYLLGQSSEDEASALEEEYFASGEILEQVWGVENDLVDAYVTDELGPEDRSAFEGHYLASALHRGRVASARALQEAQGARVSHAPVARATRSRPWLMLAAAVLIALAAAWWLGRRPEGRSDVTAQATPVPTPMTRPLEPTATAPPTPGSERHPVVAAFALSPTLLRGEAQSTPTLRVPADADELRITLEGATGAYATARERLPFVVTTVEGDRVATGLTQPGARGNGVVRIRAVRVPPGDYILSVHATGSDGEGSPRQQYFFRVLPR